MVVLCSRVARFFFVQHTKTEKIYQNEHKMYQMAINFTIDEMALKFLIVLTSPSGEA
jgi:hypothetical protein